MKVMVARIWVVLRLGVFPVLFAATSPLEQDYTRDEKPALFSYDELVRLGSAQELSPELAEKLQMITTFGVA
jgi:hypothetical protein